MRGFIEARPIVVPEPVRGVPVDFPTEVHPSQAPEVWPTSPSPFTVTEE
jgi:hypothetical protein